MTDTQTIKDRIDIVQLIGEYVPLKKSGVNWKANCPFHNEKSPSFMVHPEKQIWHCFGCSKGGDVISFIQEIEGLEFIEALRLLAKRAGVEIDTFKSEVNQSQRNRIVEINTKAAEFFHHILLEMPASAGAREYLERRGIKKDTLIEWSVGFIPGPPAGGWDLLTKYFVTKGFSLEDLVAAGLTIKRDGADSQTGQGYYDRFRGRVMFPIWDPQGTVIGFTGRILVETENSGGKYVNTPQTLAYDKSRALYGINKAKSEIKSKDLVVLVEGQMDVISCHQAGMKNVVAASGTALTPEQIRLLKRYTANIAMAFDADAAGENAGKRGVAVAMEAGMQVKVIQIPAGAGKDADECIRKNPEVWFQAVAAAREIMDWYFDITLKKINFQNPRDKQAAANVLLEQIARIPYAVERDEWLRRLGDKLGTEVNILRDELKKVKLPRGVAGNGSPVTSAKPALQIPQSQLERLVEAWWVLTVQYPEHYGAFHNIFKREYNTTRAFLDLYETAETIYTTSAALSVDLLREQYRRTGEENYVDILLLKPYKNSVTLSSGDAKKELEELLKRIHDEWRKERGKQIQDELGRAEKSGDKEMVGKLVRELQAL